MKKAIVIALLAAPAFACEEEAQHQNFEQAVHQAAHHIAVQYCHDNGFEMLGGTCADLVENNDMVRGMRGSFKSLIKMCAEGKSSRITQCAREAKEMM